MFRSFPAFVVEGRTQLLYLSGLLLVSQSLGSILSFPWTVTLSFLFLFPLLSFTHTLSHIYSLVLSYSRHRNIHISI